MHNVVNESLGKEVFDCAKIGDFYDCGCAEDEEGGTAGKKKGDVEGELVEGRKEMSREEVERVTGRKGRMADPVKEHMAQRYQYVKVE